MIYFNINIVFYLSSFSAGNAANSVTCSLLPSAAVHKLYIGLVTPIRLIGFMQINLSVRAFGMCKCLKPVSIVYCQHNILIDPCVFDIS